MSRSRASAVLSTLAGAGAEAAAAGLLPEAPQAGVHSGSAPPEQQLLAVALEQSFSESQGPAPAR